MAIATPATEAIGAAQEAFRDKARDIRENLIDSGQCEPFTIANFNPLPVGLQGELSRYKVPSPDDDRLPKDVLRITIPFDGRERVGHCLTIRDPHVYGRNVNATWHQGGGPGDAIIQREPMYYLPVAIAYNFLEHYSPIFVTERDGKAAAPPKDARKFYGILAFRGDVHTLERLLQEENPAKQVIDVPLAIERQTGKIKSRNYKWVQTSLVSYLEQMFIGQFKFADATISRAQQRWNGTDEDRKDISAADRIWYRWAIKLGYAEPPKTGEKTWLNELLTLNMGAAASDQTGGRRKCQSCRTLEPEPNTPFCPKCNAPINTFQTFMAGFPVADAWLMALRGEERDVVLEELRLRRQGFDQQAETEPETPKKRGPYKKSDKKDEIPPAASTALPGEE
jgi:hypothetical protein